MRNFRSTLRVLGKIEGLPIAIVLILLYLGFIQSAPDVFLKPRIYMTFLRTASPPLILGLGLTLVIAAGEIDLSFPALVAFTGYVFTWCFLQLSEIGVHDTIATLVAIVAAIVAGGLCGFINGQLIARLGVPAIMATLAAGFFWNGVTVLLSDGLQSAINRVEGNIVHEILTGRIYNVVPSMGSRGEIGIPTQAIWALGLTIVFWFILNRHKFGEAVLFVGDNPNVARVMGVNVEQTRILVFTLMGVMSAIAGIILTMEVQVFFPNQGQGMLLPVMAAVFIGGTSMAGGNGVVMGTFFGSYVIGSLEAGVVASGIGGFWTQLVQGLVMGASVIINTVLERGSFGGLTERLRHWTTPSQPDSTEPVSPTETLPPESAT
jgi:simple sugar transport system permease protein